MRALCLIFIPASCFGCQPSSGGGSQSEGCAPFQEKSTALNLDGGIERPTDGRIAAAPSYLLSIENADGNLIPNCTGTAVSSSTIITAAHCVATQGGPSIDLGLSRKVSDLDVCISRDDNQPTICSNLVYFDSGWDPAGPQHDLAWIAFPMGTFKDYYEVSRSSSTVGKQLIAVGYGPGSSVGPPTLRYGITSLHSTVSQSGTFLSQYSNSPTFDQIKLVSGDSGGPVLDDCKIGGVASISTTNNQNVYVDLGSQSIRTTLKAVSGRVDQNTNAHVHFCGLSVVYDDDIRKQLCPAAGLNVSKFPIENARDQFPCSRQAISLPKASEPAMADSSEPVIDQEGKVTDEVCYEEGK